MSFTTKQILCNVGSEPRILPPPPRRCRLQDDSSEPPSPLPSPGACGRGDTASKPWTVKPIEKINETFHAVALRKVGAHEPTKFNGIRRKAITSKRVRALATEGGISKKIRLTAIDIKHNSRANPRASCDCKDSNCWKVIDKKTTWDYREKLYDPDPTIGQYHVNRTVYEMIKGIWADNVTNKLVSPML
jgi:hypothetical protein